ncbi:MAG: response regulator transcription factor [Alphaproteobacteria bacterium]|nr:response regulator transcription factor [Alphaproteobacteria bacterium]
MLQSKTRAASAGRALRLTTRQIAVLRLLAEGKSNEEIGRALGVAANTIKFHIASLMQKFDADNRVRLAVVASRLLA